MEDERGPSSARYPVCSAENCYQASLGHVAVCLEARLSPAYEEDDDDDDDDDDNKRLSFKEG